MPGTLAINSPDYVKVTSSSGSLFAFGTHLISMSAEINNDAVDVTTVADTARRNLLGLQDATVRFTWLFDSNGTNSPWMVFSTKVGESTVRNIEIHPEGTASGKPKITLPMKCQSVSLPGNVGERVVFEANMVIDGSRTIGTN